MQTNNLLTRRQLIVGAILLFVILPVCWAAYSGRDNPYAAAASKGNDQFIVTNPLVLQNWLPADSYQYTIARLRDYDTSKKFNSTSMLFKTGVKNDAGMFGFTVEFLPSGETSYVTVSLTRSESALSTSVSIDNQQQNVTVHATQTDTQFSGISSLVDQGLSAYQANALQAAFKQFKDGASLVDIDSSSITQDTTESDDVDAPEVLRFSVTVDGATYLARVQYSDLTDVVLTLSNKDENVFTSEKIDGTNL